MKNGVILKVIAVILVLAIIILTVLLITGEKPNNNNNSNNNNINDNGNNNNPSNNTGMSAPNLQNNLIPVYYDESGKVWKKADKNNSDVVNKWYDYDTYMWANAVTVISSSRTTYQNASVGTVVKDSDVLTMMVWIPRYRYKLWNVLNSETSNPQLINIEFENKNTTKSTGTKNGEWYTHPVFTFGTEELDGIWVGKFETTGTIDNITVKPNTSSLRNQNIKSMFEASIAMDESGNQYGYTNVADIHMMKNTEWGAVAYLSHSKYGKFGNSSYVASEKQVWENNSSTYITGCVGNSVSAEKYSGCENAYNTTNGIKASTTGTIYGVYDMSGGSYEYVMGVMKEEESENITDGYYGEASGFTGTYFNDSSMTKYVDKYGYSSDTYDFSRYIKGDATQEVLGPKTELWYESWYKGDASFVTIQPYSWFIRKTVFGFDTMRDGDYSPMGAESGAGFPNLSFRLVTK